MRWILSFLLVILASFPAYTRILQVPSEYSTIRAGINASTAGDTVLVQPGVYNENIDFVGHNITLGSLYLTTGDTGYIGQTVINGGGNSYTVIFASGEDSTAVITGFTIRNGLGYQFEGGGIRCVNADPRILNNIIEDNLADAGGGIFCRNSDAEIAFNIIRDNSFISPLGNPGGGICCRENSRCVIKFNVIHGNANQDGAGIAVVQSSPLITNNLIYDNTASDLGGAIRCDFSSPVIVSNTIAYNFANVGGGIWLSSCPNAVITNTILWGDSAGAADEIFQENGVPSVSYCDIAGDWPGVGNIGIDPSFRSPSTGDYHLRSIACGGDADSPGIDAGDPTYLDLILNCSWGLGTVTSDMGAYGGGDSSLIEIDDGYTGIPDAFVLSQNYPNPFNAHTTIAYSLSEDAAVTLRVYSVTGQLVRTLVDAEPQPVGWHRASWDGTDERGRAVSTGVYFYRISAGERRESKVMILAK
jgi:hypothetical protein